MLRKLSRTVLHALTAVSAVLCVAVAMLWGRGHRIEEAVVWAKPSRTVIAAVGSTDGALTLTVHRVPAGAPGGVAAPGLTYQSGAIRWGPPAPRWGEFQCWVIHDPELRALKQPAQTHYYLSLPCWAVLLVLAFLPALVSGLWVGRHAAAGARARRARRRDGQWARDRCPSCGYDVRATPGRCPECGAEARAQEAGWVIEGPGG